MRKYVSAALISFLATCPAFAQDEYNAAHDKLEADAVAEGRAPQCSHLGYTVDADYFRAFPTIAINRAGLVMGHDAAEAVFYDRYDGEDSAIEYSNKNIFVGMSEWLEMENAAKADFDKWDRICTEYAGSSDYGRLISPDKYKTFSWKDYLNFLLKQRKVDENNLTLPQE